MDLVQRIRAYLKNGAEWVTGLSASKRVRFIFLGGVLLGAVSFYLLQVSIHFIELKIRLVTEEGKFLYQYGQTLAQRSESMHLTEVEAKFVSLAFEDRAGRQIERIPFEPSSARFESWLAARHDQQVQAAKKEGHEYLSHFVQSGGTLSLSGLGYRIIVPGSDKKPHLRDWVEVSYRGMLPNGKVIDESNAAPVKFPMTGVIRGWTEGLQIIGEGGEIELVVPAQLAYGSTANTSNIPAGSTLVFRIQLRKVIDSGRVPR
jgi:FKBP-type peptidyl-prolyl cis-trans isomerase